MSRNIAERERERARETERHRMEVSEVQWTRRMSSLHMCAPVCVLAHLQDREREAIERERDRESVRDCRGRERERQY